MILISKSDTVFCRSQKMSFTELTKGCGTEKNVDKDLCGRTLSGWIVSLEIWVNPHHQYEHQRHESPA